MADATIKQLQDLEKRIQDQIDKARRGQTITIIVGVALVALLIAYFGYMSSLTKEALEPKGVSMMISQKLTQQVEGLSKDAGTFVKAEAPKLLNDVITNAIDKQIPEGRVELEKAIKTQTSALLQKYEDELYKSVDEALVKYAGNMQELAAALKTEEGTREFETSLYNVIDESIRTEDLKLELESYGGALQTIDQTLAHLTSGEHELNQEQEAMLRLLAVIREITSRSELNNVKVDLKLEVPTDALDANKQAEADTAAEGKLGPATLKKQAE